MSTPIIISLGEVLWDLFPDKARFGGAPANFACHAAILGATVVMVSAVGDDPNGLKGIEMLQSYHIDTALIQRIAGAATGTEGVSLDGLGKPTFTIHADSAWDRIAWSPELTAQIANADAVYFGTLGQRSELSRSTIRLSLDTAKKSGILRVLDINLRTPFYSAPLIRESVEHCNILKLSDDELGEVAAACGVTTTSSPEGMLRALLERYQLDLLVLTRGASGALLVSPGETIEQPGIPTRVLDTVGAGDAFTATLIAGLLHGEPLKKIAHRACEASAAVCAQPGASGFFKNLNYNFNSLIPIFINMKTGNIITTAALSMLLIGSTACTQNRNTASSTIQATAKGKQLTVNGTHLIVPVANQPRNNEDKFFLLGIYEGDRLVQDFTVSLPQNKDPYWLASYPLSHFKLQGKQIAVRPADDRKLSGEFRMALDLIRVGDDVSLKQESTYREPYRNQFHASSRRGWNNDPNGMVYHDGKYHLYYQYNPFGIFWGNMHWGHFESRDLIHWEQKPIALYQKTVKDMAFSGGGFVDFNNSAGLGKNTLFIAFTSTGRGECLAYSKDGGLTFTELPENPVVTHEGRDPKIIWYEPEKKWVMVVYNNTANAATDATPLGEGPEVEKRKFANVTFYESKDLRKWNRTGAFTDPDRPALYECPELFKLPLEGQPGVYRWILLGAQNRYFIGHFDGKTFSKESGPHDSLHGAFYAAQTYSDVPDGRRIQIGWVRTDSYEELFPDQVVNQAFTLPHEMTLRSTPHGLRVFFNPVKEAETLRAGVLAEGTKLSGAQAEAMLQACQGALSEVLIEFENQGTHELIINGIDAGFTGRSARILTDSTFNEVYVDDGMGYEVRTRKPVEFKSTRTQIANQSTSVRSLKIYRLKSIWPE